jgi:RNA polymerase sigma-70 factor (ECF subfamily)
MTPEQFETDILPIKDRLYRYAQSIVYDTELAKDIVQEVFMKLWNQRNNLSEVRNIEAWSMRITRNTSLDKLKASSMKVLSLDKASYLDSGVDVPDAIAERTDLMGAIKKVLELLPEKQQEIFRLRDLIGYSNPEIGKMMALKESDVKVNLFRARKRIKSELIKLMNYGLEPKKAIAG